jgi:hypothetical protein
MIANKFLKAIALTMGVSGLVACGGGGGDDVAGIGGTGITASGSISGFGSIYVNGVKYETAGSSITINGNDALNGQDDLDLGMVVRVTGDLNNDGLTGTASSVEYDSSLKGPVTLAATTSSTTTELTIFDVPVLVSSVSTTLKGISFSDLTSTVIPYDVEVSGYYDTTASEPVLRATHLEYIGVASNVKVKGFVHSITPATLFSLDVNGDGTPDRDVETAGIVSGLYADQLSPGDYVEVTALTDNSTINASTVELEDGVLGDANGDASLEGIVTSLDSPLPGSFVLNGVTVNYGSANFEPASLATTIANGMQVEVEGTLIGGTILNAEEVEAEDELELIAFVSAIPSVDTIRLSYFPGTIDIDTVGADFDSGISVNDTLNNYVKVEGYLGVDGSIVATQVELIGAGPEDDRIQGPVSDCSVSSITILGLSFNLDVSTDYFDQNETPMDDSAAFCNAVNAGTYFAEIKDKAIADGTADEAELED